MAVLCSVFGQLALSKLRDSSFMGKLLLVSGEAPLLVFLLDDPNVARVVDNVSRRLPFSGDTCGWLWDARGCFGYWVEARHES